MAVKNREHPAKFCQTQFGHLSGNEHQITKDVEYSKRFKLQKT